MLINSNRKKIKIIGQTAVSRSLYTFVSAESDSPDCVVVSFEDAKLDPNVHDYQYLIGALRNTHLRTKIISWIKQNDLHAVSYQHPQSWLAPTASIGRGTVIFPMTSLLNCDLGDFCVISPNSHIGHDAKIGSNVLFLPGSLALGSTFLANGTVLQTGATVLDHVAISAEHVNILPKSLVTKDISEVGTYGGSPCRKINSSSVCDADYFQDQA